MNSLWTSGYAGIGVSDLNAWETFFIDCLGLMVSTREEGNGLILRMDDYEQRIIVEKNDIDDLIFLGWELQNERSLEDYVETLRSGGVEVEECAGEQAEKRKVGRLFVAADPNGYSHEFYCDPEIAPTTRPFRSSAITGRFVTGDLGYGHATTLPNNFEESNDYYVNKLGIHISDYIRQELAPNVELEAVFMHADSGRHHSLATGRLVGAPLPEPRKILDHLMVEVDNIDDVGAAFHRAKQMGLSIPKGLGRHPNDRMLSFYVTTPSGFDWEFGCQGIVVDKDNWKVVSFNQMSEWGHKREYGPDG